MAALENLDSRLPLVHSFACRRKEARAGCSRLICTAGPPQCPRPHEAEATLMEACESQGLLNTGGFYQPCEGGPVEDEYTDR